MSVLLKNQKFYLVKLYKKLLIIITLFHCHIYLIDNIKTKNKTHLIIKPYTQTNLAYQKEFQIFIHIIDWFWDKFRVWFNQLLCAWHYNSLLLILKTQTNYYQFTKIRVDGLRLRYEIYCLSILTDFISDILGEYFKIVFLYRHSNEKS